jgi:hypothetical protein
VLRLARSPPPSQARYYYYFYHMAAAGRPTAAAPDAPAAAAAAACSTLYEALGVAPGASGGDLRQAYLRAARQHHPDRQPQGQVSVAWPRDRSIAFVGGWVGLDGDFGIKLCVMRACSPDRAYTTTHASPSSPKQRPSPSPALNNDNDDDNDNNSAASCGGSASFLLIKEAWDTLSDPAKRAAYDKGLAGRGCRRWMTGIG